MECSPSYSEQDPEAQSRKGAGLEKRGPAPGSPDPKPSGPSTSPSLRAHLFAAASGAPRAREELTFDENVLLAQKAPPGARASAHFL